MKRIWFHTKNAYIVYVGVFINTAKNEKSAENLLTKSNLGNRMK